MGQLHHRACLNQLMSLSTQAEGLEHRALAAEVDRVLACNGRRACLAHLTCACIAADLAANLAQRYR